MLNALRDLEINPQKTSDCTQMHVCNQYQGDLFV